jgi:CelD/BcsL family acetyltransferase involved in cellulose biosynthesis
MTGTSVGWTVDTVNSIPDLESLAPEWDELFVSAGASLPFLTFSWAQSWWKHLCKDELAVTDRLRILVIRDEEGGLVAVAPMMLTEHPGVGPVRMRVLQFLGADGGITELRGFLCHPAHEGQVVGILAKRLANAQDEFDWIHWAGLRRGGEGEAVLVNAQVTWTRDICDQLLKMPESWEVFRAGLKRNIRESLRKCYNSLARDGHVAELVVAQTPDEVMAGLERFVELHAMRAALKKTIHHPDKFAASDRRAFLFDVCGALARTGITRVFSLKIAGQVVASRLGFQCGDNLYLYFSGFDPAWGKYSVMTTTVAEIIKYAISSGLKTVSLSVNKHVSKSRWTPTEVIYREARQLASHSRATAAFRSYEAVLQLRGYPWVNRLAGRWLERTWQ